MTGIMNNINNQAMRGEFDNLKTNSTVFTIALQQQQEGLMITAPPNFTQNSTTSNRSSATNVSADTHDTLYDNSRRQQSPLAFQPQQQ